MISKVFSCGLVGIDGFIVEVEVDISNGMPSFDIVGLPDTVVKESKERIRAAFKNCNLEFPIKRITVNLAPAHIKKEGASFDLPISIGLLAATGQIEKDNLDKYLFLGELSLNGEIREINGVLPMVLTATKKGVENVVIPEKNAFEASVAKGISVFSAKNLYDVVLHFKNEKLLTKTQTNLDEIFSANQSYNIDFSDVKGQENVKRALEIAASGGHNAILIGPPGSGKTMLAQRIPTILPDLSFEEALEVTKIFSIAGLMPPDTPLISKRPFRNPHHTISAIGLSGGGRIPKPGELSLSHHGVLFLDELPEFSKDALEVMRQPLEDGVVTVSRVMATYTYPCNTMFVASMNPCRCGYFGDATKVCTCSTRQIQGYLGKISGPLLDASGHTGVKIA